VELEKTLTERFAAAFEAVAAETVAEDTGAAVGGGAVGRAAGKVDPVVRRSAHADFQVDGALPLARRLGRAPRDLASAVVSRLDPGPLVESVEVAGPGFINVHLATPALAAALEVVNGDDRLGVPVVDVPEKALIDYSGPNVAKEMHVGHLRSTVIGDAAARLLAWLGHDVRRANHLGDWGTPFGMLIERLVDVGEDRAAHELSVGDLTAFYREARVAFDTDESFAQRSRQRVVALQSGDESTLRLWRMLVEESQKHFVAVYDRFGATLTTVDFRGESSYRDLLGPVAAELARIGLLRDSEGAACVFPSGFTGRDGEPLPLIVRKSDGGYGYAATDLAAIRYRTQELQATRLLYVVGTPQHQHLEMVFQTAREAGWLVEPATASHISFGQVLGADGRRLASRAGETIKLAALLDEGVARAHAIVTEKNPALDEATRSAVAHAVGIGAIKYADLSSDRIKDYVFDWDRMLATTGDTAAYLQYTNARVRSIFAKARVDPDRGADIALDDPAERMLGLELLGFAEVVTEVASTLEFHRLTGYLQRLAGAFTAFYGRCPVVDSDPPVRASRLALCDLTGRTMTRGLDLLGIDAPPRM
jgi:arginyl-tRNA synthetase